MLNRLFDLEENGTHVRQEISAGLTTFLTMAYIIVLQPMVLSGRLFGLETGMDFGAIMTATCVSAALATAIMGLYARYPIAQAPGMGENFFFVLTVIPAAAAAGFADAWQTALGVVFVAGVLFLLLSVSGFRKTLIQGVSPSMKNGMAVGIGLFIAFLGLQYSGLIISAASIVETPEGAVLSPGTLVKLNTHFASLDLLIFFFGLILTTVLHVRRVRGSILWGIVGITVLVFITRLGLALSPESVREAPFFAASGLMTRFIPANRLFSAPPSLAPTFFKMNLSHALSLVMIPYIVIFLFMDLFDTIGTLIGVSEQAGFVKENQIPRANRALLSDAVGTVTGSCLGTSTVTSFIESAAGVEQGGRTGLTSVTVSFLFVLSLFVSPVVAMIGSYPVITAPALVVVGAMMIRNVIKIAWDDYSESIPAFLILVGIPLTCSISDGLALGFITYPIIKILSGRGKEAHWLIYVLGVLLVFRYVVWKM